MWNQLRNKMSSGHGETIVETMVAVTVISLAIAMVFETFNASRKLVEVSENKLDTSYYQSLSRAEKREEDPSNPLSGTLTITWDEVSIQTPTITIFGGSGMYSYQRE